MNSARAPRQVAASCSRHHAFSTSSAARSRTLPSPVPIRPASQRNTAIPANVYDLTVAYPKHPLLAFFNKDMRTIKETPDAKVGKDVLVPATLRKMDLRKDSNGRGWLAPELRTKSSLELHQLWYKCLMERNKIATTDSEIQRAGARTLVKFANYNGRFIDRRVRKTMARVKFVLNERRLALIDARRRAPAATHAKTADESLAGPLYEEEVPKGA